MTMPYTEMRIAKQVIASLVHAGFTVSVNDGEETTLRHSTNQAEIFRALYTTEEDYLIACDDTGKRVGMVRLIYGNGCDLISDYTDTPALVAALAKANALADTL